MFVVSQAVANTAKRVIAIASVPIAWARATPSICVRCAISFGSVFLYSVVQLLALRVEKVVKAEQAY